MQAWIACIEFNYVGIPSFVVTLNYWSTVLKAAVSRRAANVKGSSLFYCTVTLEASQRQQLHKP